MTLPEFIGYPGKQTKGAYTDSDDFSVDYDNFVDDKIVIATLKPGKAEIRGDANIYDLKPAWGDYTTDLSLLGITPSTQGEIKVVISRLSPITRSYTNEYGDSTILPHGSILGEGAREIMQLTGRNTEELEDLLKSKAGGMIRTMAGKGVGAYNQGVNVVKNLGNMAANELGELGGAIGAGLDAMTALAKSPQSKIGWPKMWRDCSFEQSYQLQTRLYCHSTNNEDDYNNNIKACIAALEMFVCPKSDDGVLYTAPYIFEFDIPGMIHFPQAYCSSMNVVEGGDEGDFAQTGRPNVVDIQMTIQNNYSISVNTKPPGDTTYPYRPSIRKDLIGLASGKNLGKKSSYTSGTGSSTAGSNTSYEKALKQQLDASVDSEAYKQEAAKTRADRKLTDAQKNAAATLADPTSNINRTPAEVIVPESGV